MRRRRSRGGATGWWLVLAVASALVAGGAAGLSGPGTWLLSALQAHPVAQNLLLCVLAILLLQALAGRVEAALLRDVEDLMARHRTRRLVRGSWRGLAVLVLVIAWAPSIEGLGMFLGIVGAGLTVSLQRSLLCLAGWGLIVTRRPFEIGDRIEIDDRIGDVIDIRLVHTVLLEVGQWISEEQSTGRIVHVPNSQLWRHAVQNHSQGFPFLWNEVTVVVTFESDWRRGEAILLEWAREEAAKREAEVRRCLDRVQQKVPIRYRALGPMVLRTIRDEGVALTLRYLCPVRRRRGTQDELSRYLLDRFAGDPAVEFAYPTIRLFTAKEHPPGESAGARPEEP